MTENDILNLENQVYEAMKSGKIDRIFIFYQTGFLLETLVFIIEYIVHQINEQGYIPQTRCKDVKRCDNL